MIKAVSHTCKVTLNAWVYFFSTSLVGCRITQKLIISEFVKAEFKARSKNRLLFLVDLNRYKLKQMCA